MRVTKDLIAVTLSKGINTPLLLIETVLIGRILGVNGFGEWSLILAAATLLHSVFINWTHSITVKFGCEEWIQRQTCTQTLNSRIPVLILGLLITLLLLLTQPFGWLTKLYSLDTKFNLLVFLAMLNIWLSSETQANFQSTGSLSQKAILTPVITTISIIFLLFVLFFARNSDLTLIVLSISLIKIIYWASIWLYELKKINFKWQFPTFINIKQIIFFSWPLLPTLILGYCSDWGDHILIGLYCTKNEVGFWGASYQMMLGIISLNTIFVSVLLPWLISRSQLFSETPRFYLKSVVPALLSLWLFVIIILITFFPSLFFVMMGKQFNNNPTVLLILGMSILTNVFSSLYGLLFTLQNRLKRSLFYVGLMVIINFSLSILLIPKIGITGAAIGTFTSYLIGQFLYVLDQHRFLKISLVKVGIFFLSAILFGLLQYLSGIELWHRIFCCLLSLCLLILIIRKTQSIEPRFITQFFSGISNPIGFFLVRILVNGQVNEYS